MRAIAVLAVIAFHAGSSWFSGGFAGVDVFFVVSGYLITGLILPEIEKGAFSLTEFYVRRINRIFPALIVILVATLAIGWVILVPNEFRQLGRHIIGGSTFSSNFILWKEAGYFDSPDKPLLHLWSLAVEEQFYLIWPAVALFTWKRRLSARSTIALIITASFALNVWSVASGRGVAAFYSPVARFWEIMAGALLVHAELNPKRDDAPGSVGVRNLLSVIGVALIVAAFVGLNRDTHWPGWWAALPVVGTVLIIAAGQDSLINRHILSNRGVVYIGLISYPLYLWHWPLIVTTRLLKASPPSTAVMTTVVAISLVLAICTYHFVERPIRFGARKKRSAKILLVALSAVGLAGFAAMQGAARPRLNGAGVAMIDSAVRDWTYPGEGGFANNELIVHRIAGDTARKIMLLGDSHGEQYWPRMVELARVAGGTQPEIDFVTYGGCTPFPNTERRELDGRRGPFRCREYHQKAMELVADTHVTTIVYSFWWEANFNFDRYLTDLPGQPRLRSTGPDSLLVFQSLQAEIQRLRDAGKKVFIVLSNPQSPAYNPTSLLPGRLPFRLKYHPAKSIPRIEHDGFASFTNANLREIAAATGATVINPADFLCSKTECPTVDPRGNPIYKDGNHMRASFVRDHATWIDQIVAK